MLPSDEEEAQDNSFLRKSESFLYFVSFTRFDTIPDLSMYVCCSEAIDEVYSIVFLT